MNHVSMFFGLKHQEGDYTIPIILEGFFNSNYQASPLKTDQGMTSYKVTGGLFVAHVAEKKHSKIGMLETCFSQILGATISLNCAWC